MPTAPTTFSTFAQGSLVGAGLIVAIGAQNALVLRQGLLRRHVTPVVLLCAASDVLLICLGVFGLGAAITADERVLTAFRYGGAIFLAAYGLLAAWRAWGQSSSLESRPGESTLAATLLSALAMTYLNPHVYLDTVVLLGSIGAHNPAEQRWAFAAGASTASVVWFSLLGFGAAAVSGPLRRPGIWRWIDAGVACLMLTLAFNLIN